MFVGHCRNTSGTESHVQSTRTSISSSLCHLPAADIARLVRNKKISPVEVVQEHLARIQKLNPVLNAFADLQPDFALADAKRIERSVLKGEATGRMLLGVPLTIKSCIDVCGLHSAAGSRLRAAYVPGCDATLVARLKRAGAIVLGNTTTPEFLMAYHTENEIHGRTNNPWDLSRTPGGSSGGEAAAISSGMSAGGFGSDGGGSIRVPAHFCGIYGLKPTPGVVPTTGHFPVCSGPFSRLGVVGPMARTMADLRLLLEASAGHDANDPASVPVSLPESRPLQTFGLRVGYYEDDGETAPTPETAAAVRTAAEALSDAGFVVEPFRPDGLSRARELWSVIFVECGARLLNELVRDHEDEISPNTREFLRLASEQPPLTAERLLMVLMESDQLRRQTQAQMQKFPILLAPVCATPAFRHEEAGWGESHAADYLRTMTYSQHYNLLGNPALAMPVAQSSDGLPIGVQIVGRHYRDMEVLAVADILDQQFTRTELPFSSTIG
jgi:Asp-tRNA(Asn)/Glu-tRNA(Gln) amidotransferase A subunit family amidase